MNGGCHRIPGAGSPPSCSWQKMCSCMLSCCLALQHLAVQASLLCIFHLLLLPTLPEEQPQAASELLARSLFACGISTILQTCLGSRLPLVQIPSFEYLVPAMVLSSHRSVSASADRNGTAAASVCPAPHCDIAGSRAASLREVSGAVVVSGLVQLVLGASGVCGWAARRCGPMVLAPSLSIVGLSAYKEAAFFCSANWGASAPRCHLLPASGVLPPALLCLGGLRGAVHPHPAHILGAAPICWHLHRVRHPQPPPHPLGLAGAGHGTAALGQQHWPLPVALDPLPRRGRVAAAHPPGAGGGHRHGRRRQRQLGGLLRAVREAAASPPPAPGCLQPGPLRRGAGQPAGRAAGRRGRHGLQHRQRLRQQPHAGWLSPLGASERTGVRAAGHVPQAGRAPHPHPAGGSRRGALRDLRCGCGHGYLLLPVRGHRLREEHLYCRLHHVHGPAGATVAQHHSGSLGHRLGASGPPLPLPADGACLLNWLLVLLPGKHGLRHPGGARAARQGGSGTERRSLPLGREGRHQPRVRAPRRAEEAAASFQVQSLPLLLPLPGPRGGGGGGGGRPCRRGGDCHHRGRDAPAAESRHGGDAVGEEAKRDGDARVARCGLTVGPAPTERGHLPWDLCQPSKAVTGGDLDPRKPLFPLFPKPAWTGGAHVPQHEPHLPHFRREL
ncbi:solute carrier family 23 member 3 isoform X2 [Rhea pennata]|uniref:solute carrier family 23 member 3 isoform X2 n=1 Tax=Rhea pennata TaxID=8795 RepID=UPI002E25D8BE